MKLLVIIDHIFFEQYYHNIVQKTCFSIQYCVNMLIVGMLVSEGGMWLEQKLHLEVGY